MRNEHLVRSKERFPQRVIALTIALLLALARVKQARHAQRSTRRGRRVDTWLCEVNANVY